MIHSVIVCNGDVIVLDFYQRFVRLKGWSSVWEGIIMVLAVQGGQS